MESTAHITSASEYVAIRVENAHEKTAHCSVFTELFKREKNTQQQQINP